MPPGFAAANHVRLRVPGAAGGGHPRPPRRRTTRDGGPRLRRPSGKPLAARARRADARGTRRPTFVGATRSPHDATGVEARRASLGERMCRGPPSRVVRRRRAWSRPPAAPGTRRRTRFADPKREASVALRRQSTRYQISSHSLRTASLSRNWLRRALEHDAALPHHVEPMRNGERDRQLLLDQQDRDATARDLLQQAAHALDDHRREPLGRLVHHDEVRIAHQRAADRQELLFAPRQHAAGSVGALPQHREEREHVVLRPPPGTAAGFHAERQVLANGERRKDRPILGHVAEPSAGDLVRLELVDSLALEADAADRGNVAHDRLDGGRPAGAVAAEQAHDLALADAKRDALQDVALAVVRVEVVDLKHAPTPDKPSARRRSGGSSPARRSR